MNFIKTVLFLTLYLFSSNPIYSQSGWYSVTLPNDYFSFSLPGEPQTAIDTLDVAVYSFSIDSIVMFCSLARYDSAFQYYVNVELLDDSLPLITEQDTMANPIFGITEFLKYNYDIVYNFNYTNIELEDSTKTGREFELVYENYDKPKTIFALQMYYNGHDILCFTIEAPYAKLQEFSTIKEQFFSSILIN